MCFIRSVLIYWGGLRTVGWLSRAENEVHLSYLTLTLKGPFSSTHFEEVSLAARRDGQLCQRTFGSKV